MTAAFATSSVCSKTVIYSWLDYSFKSDVITTIGPLMILLPAHRPPPPPSPRSPSPHVWPQKLLFPSRIVTYFSRISIRWQVSLEILCLVCSVSTACCSRQVLSQNQNPLCNILASKLFQSSSKCIWLTFTPRKPNIHTYEKYSKHLPLCVILTL